MRRRSPQQISKRHRRKNTETKGRFVLSVFFTLPIQIRSWSLRRRFPSPLHRRYVSSFMRPALHLVARTIVLDRSSSLKAVDGLYLGGQEISSFVRPALHLVTRAIILDWSSSLKAVDGLYLEGQEKLKDPKDK